MRQNCTNDDFHVVNIIFLSTACGPLLGFATPFSDPGGRGGGGGGGGGPLLGFATKF